MSRSIHSRRSAGNASRRSLSTNIPSVSAIAVASERTSSGVSSVSAARTIRQSGSFSHSRRCMKARVRMLRRACSVATPCRSRLGPAADPVVPERRDVGADAHAVDDADRRPERAAAAEQEGVRPGALADRLEAAPQRLRRASASGSARTPGSAAA